MFRRVLIGLLGLALFLVLVICSLLFTQGASRYLANMLDAGTDLEIEYGGGSLFNSLHLARLTVSVDGVHVELNNIHSELDGACLWRGSVCLEYLRVAELNVIVGDAEEEVEDEESSPFWPLPFQVGSDRVSIDSLLVQWDSGNLAGQSISASAEVYGSQIHIFSARGSSVWLDIPPDEAPTEYPLHLPEVDLPVDLLVDELTLEDSGWLINGLQNQYGKLQFSGQWFGRELQVHSLAVMNDEWGGAELVGRMEFLHPYPLSASAQYEAAAPSVWQGLHGSSGKLGIEGDLQALVLDVDHCGDVNLQGTAEVRLLEPNFPTVLEARGGCSGASAPLVLKSLPGMEAATDVEVGEGWELNLRGNLNAQEIKLEAVVLGYGQQLQVDGRARHADERVSIQSLRVEPVADPSQALEAKGELSYQQGVHWDIDLALDSVQLPVEFEQLYGHLSGLAKASGTWEAQDWQLLISDADLSGQLNDRAVTIAGRVQLGPGLETNNSALDIRSGDDHLQLIDLPTGLPQGRLALADLGAWLPDAEGNLHATLEWHADSRRLQAQGGAEGLVYGALRARSLALAADLDLRSGVKGELSATLDHALLGDTRLQQLGVHLQGSEQSHQATLSLEGDVAALLNLRGGMDDGDWRGELQPLSLSSDLGDWVLADPVSLSYSSGEGQLSLADHCWRGGAASVCARDAAIGTSGSILLEMTGSLQDLQGVLPERYSLSGDISGTLNAQWLDFEPTGVVANLRLGEGSLKETVLGEARADYYRWDSLSLDYQGDSKQGRLWGSLQRGGESQLALDLFMPAAVDGVLSGELFIKQFELVELRPFAPGLNRIKGSASGLLSFSGTVAKPLVKGELALRDGLFSLSGNPTEVEGLSLGVRFMGDSADILGQFRIGEGSSDLSGKVRWDEAASLQLSLKGDSKPLLYPTDTVVEASEDLLLEIDAEGVRLSGDIWVNGGEFVLDDIPESAIEVSDDVVLLDYTGQVTRPVASRPVSLDVRVYIDDQFEFRTEGIEARLGGELELVRKVGEPVLVLGKLQVPEGRFDLLGPRFDVTRGQITFVGAPDNAELNLAMEREITEDQVTVGIRVAGNMQLPQIEFYSRPALPEAEVMAYALGGRGVDRQGAGDGLGLAMAMTSSLMQSTGILSGLSLGVEGKDNNTRAVIGGYVSERIYLSYGVGVYEPVNTLTVRLDIIRSLWMEVVSSLKSSADLYYSWSTR